MESYHCCPTIGSKEGNGPQGNLDKGMPIDISKYPPAITLELFNKQLLFWGRELWNERLERGRLLVKSQLVPFLLLKQNII